MDWMDPLKDMKEWMDGLKEASDAPGIGWMDEFKAEGDED